jgi:hypothetical protein
MTMAVTIGSPRFRRVVGVSLAAMVIAIAVLLVSGR